MTVSMTPMPAPAWLRELASARASYQELLGWPVSVQVGQRNLVVAIGEILHAIAMPAGLGARVAAQSRISILPAPVIANADGTRWTFLAKADRPIRASVADDLSAARVTFAPPGSYVVIPATMGPSTGRVERWIEAPQPNRALPPSCAIVGLARRLIYGEHLDRSA
jgi:hypothetical protein